MHQIKPRKDDLLLIAEIADRKPDTVKRIILRQGNYKHASGPVVELVLLAWQKVVASQLALHEELHTLKQQYQQLP